MCAQVGPAAVARAVGERAAGSAEGVREARAPGCGRTHQLHPRALHDWGHGAQAGTRRIDPLNNVPFSPFLLGTVTTRVTIQLSTANS